MLSLLCKRRTRIARLWLRRIQQLQKPQRRPENPWRRAPKRRKRSSLGCGAILPYFCSSSSLVGSLFSKCVFKFYVINIPFKRKDDFTPNMDTCFVFFSAKPNYLLHLMLAKQCHGFNPRTPRSIEKKANDLQSLTWHGCSRQLVWMFMSVLSDGMFELYPERIICSDFQVSNVDRISIQRFRTFSSYMIGIKLSFWMVFQMHCCHHHSYPIKTLLLPEKYDWWLEDWCSNCFLQPSLPAMNPKKMLPILQVLWQVWVPHESRANDFVLC